MVYIVKYYDQFGHFPFEKKKICVTLSRQAIDKLAIQENRSGFIDKIIRRNIHKNL